MNAPPLYGQLDITLSFVPLNVEQFFVMPVITIDGRAHPRPWGRHVFDLERGSHHLAVTFPSFLLGTEQGLAVLRVDVHRGQSTVVAYSAPFFRFFSGTLKLVGTGRATVAPSGPQPRATSRLRSRFRRGG